MCDGSFLVAPLLSKTVFRRIQVFEFALSEVGQISRLGAASDLCDSVRGIQQFAAARAGAARAGGGRSNSLLNSGDARQEEVALELRVPGTEEPKYSLYIADGDKKGALKFCIFIVPQGRSVFRRSVFFLKQRKFHFCFRSKGA